MTPTDRWRPRVAPRPSRVCLVACSLAAAAPRAGAAGPPRDDTIDTQLFQPAIGPRNFLTVESTSVPEHKLLGFRLALTYQRHPYTMFTQGTTGSTQRRRLPVEGRAVGVDGPLRPLPGRHRRAVHALPGRRRDRRHGHADRPPPHRERHRRRPHRGQGAARDDGRGRRIHGRGVRRPVAAHRQGDSRPYLGDKNVTGRIKAIGAAELGKLRAAANLGILLRETSYNFTTELGHQLLYGAAAAYPVDTPRRPDAGGLRAQRPEPVHRASTPTSTRSRPTSPAATPSTACGRSPAGGGRGFGNGIGAPDLRLFAAAAFAPDFRDRDHDGVYDVDDKCPDQPEDRDGFQDQDGCPDPDNDNDGIPDAQDKCPNEAEDLDSSRTRTAAPSPTTTRTASPTSTTPARTRAEDGKGKRPHGRLPVDDRGQRRRRRPRRQSTSAPTSPRTATASRTTTAARIRTTTATASPTTSTTARTTPRTDGFEDEDGCPDPDNDKDGIPDADDNARCRPRR